jgi:N-acetylmuramoyl-L-alanine amidase
MCKASCTKKIRKEEVCMLKIHSFLHSIKEFIRRSGIEGYKTCLMVAVYSMAAVIIVLCADSSYAQMKHQPEAYAKAASVNEDAFEKAKEETAKKAQIRAENENINVLAQTVLEGRVAKNTEDFSLQVVDRTIIAADKLTTIVGQTFEESVNGYVVKESGNEDSQSAKAQDEKKPEQEQNSTDSEKVDKVAASKEKTTKKNKQKEEKEKKKNKDEAVQAISLAADQKEVLLRIVEAEATGEDIKGKMLVANVILNRVKSSQFPDTVEGVVFQKNGGTAQFSPIADGRYWSVTVTKETRKAVERVLNGEDESQGALYFSARSKADKSNMSWFDKHLTWLFKYGGHEFYK